MSDWLESAEKKVDHSESRSEFKKRIHEKKFMIGKNFEANGEKYQAFIDDLVEFVKRANMLPEKEREPYGKLNSRYKENRLNNHYYFFGSSRRETKREYSGGIQRLFKKSQFMNILRIRQLFKRSHFKYIRVIYFTVSSHSGLADIEIKERSMRRHRMSGHDDKKTSSSSKKTSRIFRYNIKDMDRELAHQVLDWLAYKIDKEKLNFYKEEFGIR